MNGLGSCESFLEITDATGVRERVWPVSGGYCTDPDERVASPHAPP